LAAFSVSWSRCKASTYTQYNTNNKRAQAYCARPRPGWLWWRNWWNDWQGKLKYSDKTCPSAALSTTNPTCCPDANPDRRGVKPASNRLSYGTAIIQPIFPIKFTCVEHVFIPLQYFIPIKPSQHLNNVITS
jgi:hypothetical protein